MFYTLPFLLTAIIYLFFGYLTIIKTKNIKINFILLLLILSITMWQSIHFLSQYLSSEYLYLSIKIEYIGVILIPILYSHLIFLILNINKQMMIKVGYILASIFLVLLFLTDKIIAGYQEYDWGIYQQAGDWHFLFIIFTVSYITVGSTLLMIEYRKKNIIIERKKQIFYFMLATYSCSLSAVDFIPDYGINIYPFGFVFLWFFIGFMFYAIVKYNLISTKAILNYSFVIFILSITSYIFWLTVLTTEYYFIGANFFEKSVILNMIIMPVFVYVSIEIYKKVRKLAYNIFENFNKQEQIYKFITEIAEQNSPEKAIKYILEKLPLILKSDVAFIFNQNEKYEIISGVNFDAEIRKENLSDFYLRDRKLTRIEELNLKAVFPDSKNTIIRDLMNRHNIAIIMHLNKNICFLLQKKDDNNIFYQEEIEFLEEIANTISRKIS